ncbi:MAG: hypothetical protein CM15mP115_25070 [Alphaproteobacteria bacterium]|nr:MAG: hypothetical protein CM15mP115_25070 [Alphaproteobacteria bacterium]
MPVLNDLERAEIGTLYKQVSPFEAKRRGAAIVARNISHHIDTQLADATKDFAPLVYCWRGGRGGAPPGSYPKGEIGWQGAVVEGGYKSYRKKGFWPGPRPTFPPGWGRGSSCGVDGQKPPPFWRSPQRVRVIDLEEWGFTGDFFGPNRAGPPGPAAPV